MRNALLAWLVAASCGCSPYATLSFPNVPSPVLLGPVERVGGATASAPPVAAPAVARLDVEIERKVVATRASRRAKLDDPRKASFAALSVTDAQKGADVHVDEIAAGSYFFFGLAVAVRDDWVTVKGDVRRAP